MGCVGGKQQGRQKKEKANDINLKNEKQAENKTAAAPVPQGKLTPQQINQRRKAMKDNLEQGHAQPPRITAPNFGAVLSFDKRD